MRHLQEEDDEAFRSQFSRFIKNGITADTVCRQIVIVEFKLISAVVYYFTKIMTEVMQ